MGAGHMYVRHKMVHLALTRSGFERYLARGGKEAGPLWTAAGVLAAAELTELRSQGADVSGFSYCIDPCDQPSIAGAIETIQEHHPGQKIWIDGFEADNPSELGRAFLNGETIPGVAHEHNELVQIRAGPYAGSLGSLVSVLTLIPEPKYIVELESGSDAQIMQSELGRTDV